MTQPTTHDAHPLHAATFALWGSRLIEASAGTGKTWTIAALYLRLVLGHGGADGFARPLSPADILVMTFTRAATRELSDRIRARLLEAARCFRGEQPATTSDPFLQGLLADYPEGPVRRQAAWRLATAADAMDDAAVFTIDAWCQRMLREHAFDSGNLFEETLLTDETTLLHEATQDYWRQHCYPLAGETLKAVLGIWPGVQALEQDMRALVHAGQTTPHNHAAADPAHMALADWLPHTLHPLVDLLEARQTQIGAMRRWLLDELFQHRTHWHGVKLKTETAQHWLDQLQQWAQHPLPLSLPALDKGLTRLTPDGLLDARSKSAPPVDIPDCFDWFARLVAQYTQSPPAVDVRRHAAQHVGQRMAQLKQHSGQFGFADMLTRLDTALRSPSGARLRERILAQYPVALIDEFQDTSPLQYGLFEQIYRPADNAVDSALLLIGDPKQSIYGFRGADIYSYLRARRATQGRHYVLGTNFRSTHAMVAAVNHGFVLAERQQAQGAFLFRTPQDNPLPFTAVAAHGRPEVLLHHGQPLPALTMAHDLQESLSKEAVQQRFAQHCAEQIVQWLNAPDTGFAHPERPFQRLRPADIAVLVRSGQEANAVRAALQQRGMASVYLSDRDSVFQGSEAQDLLHWLRGVATPQDASLVRAALATGLAGLSLEELAHLAASDEAFEQRSAPLHTLQQVWQSQGVLAMLRQSLHLLGLAARWLRQDGGERRLTNYLHLAELLQHASAELDGEHALIRWLQLQIAEGTGEGDEPILRLESDADLVQVITVHKSKGLEYPVVCLPFATGFREVKAQNNAVASVPDAQGQRELVLQWNDDALDRAERERLREDLRLLYVALTRPRHALWMGFAALKSGNGKDCQTHKSAAGYLIGGPLPRTPTDWLDTLQRWAAGTPQVTLQAAAAHATTTRLQPSEPPMPLRPPEVYRADFDRDWTIASYSRLTRDLKSPVHTLSAWDTPRPADDEWTAEADRTAPVPPVAALQHRFPRGPLAGNFLHDQLEWLASERFALSTQPELATRLRMRCEQSGYGDHADGLQHWLHTVAHTPLPGPGAALAQIDTLRTEMEFWLPAHRLDVAQVDALCRAHLLPGLPRPALQASRLHGMLMGFADLVFEHQGRYWVLDYKSNHLGTDDRAYHPKALNTAMLEHRYDVQAAVYLLALHRLLRSRLGTHYDPATHLGGAVYLFLRGIEAPTHGTCVLDAPHACLQALDAMLGAKDTAP